MFFWYFSPYFVVWMLVNIHFNVSVTAIIRWTTQVTNVCTLYKIGCVKIIFTFSSDFYYMLRYSAIHVKHFWMYLHYIMVNVMDLAGFNIFELLFWCEFFFQAQIEVDHDIFFYIFLNFLLRSLLKPTFISHNFISKTVRYHNMYSYCSYMNMYVPFLQEFRVTNGCFERYLWNNCNICHLWITCGSYHYFNHVENTCINSNIL